MEFNEKIRMLRRNAGLTQRQVADAVGVTYRTYQNYEAGASKPSGGVALRLAAALGVSTDTLLGTRDLPPAEDAGDAELQALLAEMQALADMKVSLLQINTQKKGNDTMLVNLTVGCKNIGHYDSIVSRLRNIRSVLSVTRGFGK